MKLMPVCAGDGRSVAPRFVSSLTRSRTLVRGHGLQFVLEVPQHLFSLGNIAQRFAALEGLWREYDCGLLNKPATSGLRRIFNDRITHLGSGLIRLGLRQPGCGPMHESVRRRSLRTVDDPRS